VVSQSPEADKGSAKGSEVTLVLSSGPGDVEVPKLNGHHVASAQKQLEKIGLVPVVRWVDLAETPTMVVLSQKPAAGEKQNAGGEVVLTVCRR
jgi:serine/threonine-protein kinase